MVTFLTHNDASAIVWLTQLARPNLLGNHQGAPPLNFSTFPWLAAQHLRNAQAKVHKASPLLEKACARPFP